MNRSIKFNNLTDEEIDLTLHTALVDAFVGGFKFSSAITWLTNENNAKNKVKNNYKSESNYNFNRINKTNKPLINTNKKKMTFD